MIPNLFIVGAPKCGTTAWVEYLRSHPDIFFSPIKEPHHFARDFGKWCFVRERDAYLALFKEAGSARILGEGSVRYLYSKVAAEEIRKFNPDARILIFLREQEDFLPSLHNQQLWNRDEAIESFEQVWQMSGQRPADSIPSNCREPSFLDYKAMGRFHEQVERFYAAFPSNQIKVISFQQWVADPRPTYLEILEFLGLEDDGRTEFHPVNEARHHRSKLVASLTKNPAPWVRQTSKLLTRLAGRQMGLLTRLRSINSGRGYRATNRIEPALRQEIRNYYAAENEKLRLRLNGHIPSQFGHYNPPQPHGAANPA